MRSTVYKTHTTTYYLTVTDSNVPTACIDLDTVVVTVLDTVEANITTPNTTICHPENGGTIQLNVVAEGGSGTGYFLYNWTPAAGLSATNIANPIATPTSTTKYYVTVTDTAGNACAAIDSVTITVNTEIAVNITAANDSICNAAPTKLSSTVNPAVAYTYEWSSVPVDPSLAPAVLLNSTNPEVTPTVTTTYQLIVTNNTTLCKDTANYTLNVLAPIIVEAGAGTGARVS